MRESSLDAYSADDLLRFRREYRNLIARVGSNDPETGHPAIDKIYEFDIEYDCYRISVSNCTFRCNL
jgi:hypothetical protein